MTYYWDKMVDVLWYNMATVMMDNDETTFNIMETVVPGRFSSRDDLKRSLQKELRTLDRESIESKPREEIVTKED